MTEILLSNRPYSTDTLKSSYGIDVNPYFQYSEEQIKHMEVRRIASHARNCISPNKAYPIGATVSATDRRIATQLSNPRVAKKLTDFSTTFGADTTVAMAQIRKKLEGAGFGGVNTLNTTGGLYSGKVDKFLDSVQKYQDAVLKYRGLIEAKSSKDLIKAGQLKVDRMHQNLQNRFQAEMRVVNSNVKPNSRGTVMSSSTRATRIAQSSRGSHLAKLNVTSQVQANNLVKFGKNAKLLGNGLAAIDFTSRASGVIQTAGDGGNWEREMFVQSATYGAGALTGYGVGTAAVAIIIMLSPVGWVALIGAGTVAIAATVGSAAYVGNAVEKNADSWYDNYLALLRN